MSISLAFFSFLAGILTILAPCVLPTLPIIIGGSVGGDEKNKFKPYIITASLAISLFLFTLLLKVTSVFIGVDPAFWTGFSGVILILLGLVTLFPETWTKINVYFNLQGKSDQTLENASKRSGIIGDIMTGAALGPVFSSCSPTYVFILSTVLTVNIAIGIVYILIYILGLVLIMLLVSLFGRSIIKRLKFATNPNGIFKKIIGILFIIVGLLIFTGQDKALETAISRYLPISQSNLEKRFLLNNLEGGIKTDNSQLLNVNPSKPAPELTGLDSWINSDPQTIQNLKGKVVLVDFWTYSCINCIVTQPYLNAWHDEYQDDGLVILGIHAPEFSFEKKRENVEKAVIDAKIEYPVALDNDFETWNAFENRFWPAKYLIDKDGNIRYYHAGEGDYEETEKAIQALLGIDQQLSTNNIPEIDRVSTKQTPETYLGWSREENYARRRDIKENESANYESDGITLESNQWILDGQFNVKNEGVLSERDNNRLKINFTAKDVYLVAGNEINSGVIEVLLNGNPIAISPNQKGANVNGQSQVTIDSDKTYHLVSFDSLKENQTLELIIPNGVRVNVFTFGSN